MKWNALIQKTNERFHKKTRKQDCTKNLDMKTKKSHTMHASMASNQ